MFVAGFDIDTRRRVSMPKIRAEVDRLVQAIEPIGWQCVKVEPFLALGRDHIRPRLTGWLCVPHRVCGSARAERDPLLIRDPHFLICGGARLGHPYATVNVGGPLHG